MHFSGRITGTLATGAFAAVLASSGAGAAEVVSAAMETDLVPSPLNYTVLLPDGYETSGKTYPLFFWLHGGNGDEKFLHRIVNPPGPDPQVTAVRRWIDTQKKQAGLEP